MSIPPGRRQLFPRGAIRLDDVADQVEHICQLASNSRHAAIGGDTDGQGGCEGAPADVLSRRGFPEAYVENIMFKNWLRVLSG